MSKLPIAKPDSFEKPASKNIKNIYVHKINSLIKISRDSMAVDQVGVLAQNKMAPKKIKKIYSETDKNALKLEKNRQSARKARQRKNLYIKLLENQVVFLRKQLAESEIVANSSQNYLKQVKGTHKEIGAKRQSSVQEELDRYISQDNLPNLDESKQRSMKKTEKLRQTVQEYKNWFIPELFKSISNLKKSQRTNLHTKIFRNAAFEFESVARSCKTKNEYSLRLLLPFEESCPETKVTNILRTLNKNMQDLQVDLSKLSEISQEAAHLIINQEINQLQFTQIERNRVRNIVSEMELCGLGDNSQKIMERALRWDQFPNADILTTMQKTIEFNKFIEATIADGQQIPQQMGEESEMGEQKE